MTRIPFPPEPVLSGDGRLMVVVDASFVIAAHTDGSGVETIPLTFEPSVVAVAPSGRFLAAAGEGRLAIATGGVVVVERDLPIEEPVRLGVTDDGTAVALDDTGLARVRPDGALVSAALSGCTEELVVVGDTVAFVSGPAARYVVAGDGTQPTVVAVDLGVPRHAVRAGDRLALLIGSTVVLLDVDRDGSVGEAEHLDVGEVERIAASPSGRYAVTAAVSWDGQADRLALTRIDVSSGEQASLETADLRPDVAMAVDDDGGVVVAWGRNDPPRLVARRLTGDGSDIEVDLDALREDED